MLINFFFANKQTKKILYSHNIKNEVFNNLLIHELNELFKSGIYFDKFCIENTIYCVLYDEKYIYFAHVNTNYPFEKIYNYSNDESFLSELQNYINKCQYVKSQENFIFFNELYEKYKNPETKVKIIANQLNDVKKLIIHNIEKIIDRGEKIETIVDSSQALLNSSRKFEKQTIILKKKMCCKSEELTLFITIVVLLVLIAVILILYFDLK
jgi:hypothetical protein